MPLITVCTATYNYRLFLHRVYESLKTQTFQDFEWIIIDDGSEDNTEELVARWIGNKDFFPIRYFRLPKNRGKMYATNQGIKKAEGFFFLDIGGDDALKPFALEHLVTRWESIEDDVKPEIAALITNCEDQYGEMVGDHFPSDPLICDYFEKMFLYKIKGDKCQLYKTDILRQFPYYDHIDRHVSNSATFFDIAYYYKLYCFEDSLYIYFRHEKNKVSLSQKTQKLRFIKGRQFYAEQRINKYFDRIHSLKFKFLTFASYIRYSCHSGLTLTEMTKRIYKKRYKLAFISILPVGIALVIFDLLRKKV